MSLRMKLLLPLAGTFLFCSLLFHFSWRPYFLDNERDEIIEREQDVLRNLSYQVELDLLAGEFEKIYATLDRLRQLNADEDYRVALFDSQGRRLYPETEVIKPPSKYHVQLEHPLAYGGIPQGRLEVAVDWSERYEEASQQLRAVEMLLLGLFGSALLIVSIVQHYLVLRPLSRLSTGAKRLASGDFEFPMDAQGRDEAGQLMQAFERMRTSLKLAQSKLESQAREASHNLIRLSTVLESMPCGLVIVDQNREIIEVNSAAEALFGLSAKQLVGERSDRLIPDNLLAIEAEVVGAMLPTLRSSALELQYLRGDGQRLDLHLWQALMYLGEQACTVNIVLDISQLKKAESKLRSAKEEAERANRAKSDFLSRMSHELRTPLNAILGFAQCLELDSDALTPSQKDSVDEILHAGRYLLGLINEMLDLSRIESGRMEMVSEPVKVAALADACANQVRPLASQRQIRLELEIDPALRVQADPTRLRQVLINLLSNAIKYNQEGGIVRVVAAPAKDQQVRVAVEDTGPGVSAASLPRLFEPFERGDVEGVVEGTGIGLALVKQLIEAMGGSVGVDSEPPSGSVFWFQLPVGGPLITSPLAATGPDQLETRSLSATAQPGKKVLYVEDNPANLRLVQRLLERHSSLELIAADSAEIGLEQARRHRPELILLDINLPGVDGFDALRQLQEDRETAAIPVIAVSASAMPRDVERGLAAGFKAYLTKPLDIPLFLRTIEQVLPGTTRMDTDLER